MRAILKLVFMLAAAQTALAADVTTNYDIRSAQVLLKSGQHKTVGWMPMSGRLTSKIGTNFDAALDAKLAGNGFTVGNIYHTDFKFVIASAEVTLRRSGKVKSVQLADLDDDPGFIVPAYKPRPGAIPEIARARVQGHANPDAAAIGSSAQATGSAVKGYGVAAVVTYGVTALIASIVESSQGSTEEGGEGLLQVQVRTAAEKGAKRTDIVISVMPKTDMPVGELFNVVADAIVQVLMRGDDLAGTKPAQPEATGADS